MLSLNKKKKLLFWGRCVSDIPVFSLYDFILFFSQTFYSQEVAKKKKSIWNITYLYV